MIRGVSYIYKVASFCILLQVSAVTFPLMESLKKCIELWMRCNLYRFSKNPPELLLTEKSSYSLKIDIYPRIPHVLYLLYPTHRWVRKPGSPLEEHFGQQAPAAQLTGARAPAGQLFGHRSPARSRTAFAPPPSGGGPVGPS